MAESHPAPNEGALTNTKGGLYLLRKLNEPALNTDSHRMRPIVSAQLVHDIAYMPFHCVFTYCQGISRLLVRQTIGDMLQHLNLSVGETILINMSRQLSRNLWGEAALSGGQGTYGFNEFMAQRAF